MALNIADGFWPGIRESNITKNCGFFNWKTSKKNIHFFGFQITPLDLALLFFANAAILSSKTISVHLCLSSDIFPKGHPEPPCGVLRRMLLHGRCFHSKTCGFSSLWQVLYRNYIPGRQQPPSSGGKGCFFREAIPVSFVENSCFLFKIARITIKYICRNIYIYTR